MKVIGIAAPAGGGKDTVGDMIRHRLIMLGMQDNEILHVKFAAGLKSMLAAVGLPEPGSAEEKEAIIPGLGFSWRTAAQDLGTKWGRGLNADLWVLLAKRKMHAFFDNGGKVVFITDLRFENESAMVREMGGSVWHVMGRRAPMAKATAQHVSERPLPIRPLEDVLIENNRTLDHLQEQVWANLIGYI